MNLIKQTRYGGLTQGPRLPIEVIGRILTFVPSSNKLDFPARANLNIYVDGILHRAILDPSSLLPHYKDGPHKFWKLEDIASRSIKPSVLDDASLANSFDLRAVAASGISIRNLIRVLQSTNTSHRLKSLEIELYLSFDTGDLLKALTSTRSLEKLCIEGPLRFNSSTPLQVECKALKILQVDFEGLPALFSSGIQLYSSLTKLTLYCQCEYSSDAWDNTAHMLSRLVCLEEFCIFGYQDVYDQPPIPKMTAKVKSASLRSLDLHSTNAVHIIKSFSDCHINRIALYYPPVMSAKTLFPDVKELRLYNVSTLCRYRI